MSWRHIPLHKLIKSQYFSKGEETTSKGWFSQL